MKGNIEQILKDACFQTDRRRARTKANPSSVAPTSVRPMSSGPRVKVVHCARNTASQTAAISAPDTKITFRGFVRMLVL
jgi:hypothetical protein